MVRALCRGACESRPVPLWLALVLVAVPATLSAGLAFDGYRTTSPGRTTWAIAMAALTVLVGFGLSSAIFVGVFSDVASVPAETRSEALAAGIEAGSWPAVVGASAGGVLGLVSGLVRGLVASRTFGPPGR